LFGKKRLTNIYNEEQFVVYNIVFNVEINIEIQTNRCSLQAPTHHQLVLKAARKMGLLAYQKGGSNIIYSYGVLTAFTADNFRKSPVRIMGSNSLTDSQNKLFL
jgi:hypothetical protein